MRGRLTISLLLLGLALPAGAGAAETYAVDSETLYVRNKIAGYVLGTLVRGDTFEVERTARRGRWAYGRVTRGAFGVWGKARCGWVQLSGLKGRGVETPAICPGDPGLLIERRLFRRGSYIARAGTGAVRPVVTRACADPRAYGNYSPPSNLFASPYGLLPSGRGPEVPGFGLRYVSKDGQAALVKDRRNPAGAPAWFFVRSACVLRAPVHVGSLQPGIPAASKRVKPGLFEPFKDAAVGKLRWKRFGSLRAVGRGRARVNTCMPTCANGQIVRKGGAKVTLSQPRLGSCHGKRRFYYTNFTIKWPSGGAFPKGDSRGELVARC